MYNNVLRIKLIPHTDENLSTLGSLALFSIIALILTSSFSSSFTTALCCADDEAMAVVAKNLAFGQGYSMSVHYSGDSGLFPFDPGITTGPTLILPASLLIALFGNLSWLPGLATLLTIATLSALVILLLSRVESGIHGLLFGSVLLVVVSGLIGPYAWVGLLGEIPAALYAVAAIVIWAVHPHGRYALAAASLMFGLAALTKLLAVLCIVPFAAVLAWRLFFRDRSKRSIVDAIVAVSLIAAPFLAFELFKLISLGIENYIEIFKGYASFVSRTAAPGSSVGSISKVLENAEAFRLHFGVSPLLLISIEILGALIVAGSSAVPDAAKRMYYFFATAALLNWSWLLGFSVGWPRYANIGLVMDAAALATLAASLYRTKAIAFVALALLVHAPAPIKEVNRTWNAAAGLTSKSERLLHLEAAAAILEQLPDETILVGGWWPTVIGLEYLLPGSDNFVRYDRVSKDQQGAPMVLVRNTMWTTGAQGRDPQLQNWEQKCSETIFEKPPYLISRCPVVNAEAPENLERAMSGVISSASPAPRVRPIAGGWDLFAHAPAAFRLPVPDGVRTFEIGFGMDAASWQANDGTQPDGVCFVVEAEREEGSSPVEVFRSCLDPVRSTEHRSEQFETLPVGSETESFILRTEPVANTNWDWSHWSKLEFD